MPLIRAYCNWKWFILDVRTLNIGKYLYLSSMRTGADNSLNLEVEKFNIDIDLNNWSVRNAAHHDLY